MLLSARLSLPAHLCVCQYKPPFACICVCRCLNVSVSPLSTFACMSVCVNVARMGSYGITNLPQEIARLSGAICPGRFPLRLSFCCSSRSLWSPLLCPSPQSSGSCYFSLSLCAAPFGFALLSRPPPQPPPLALVLVVAAKPRRSCSSFLRRFLLLFFSPFVPFYSWWFIHSFVIIVSFVSAAFAFLFDHQCRYY